MGRPEATTLQDIQLSGLGIMEQHCVMDVEDGEVSITPMQNARSVRGVGGEWAGRGREGAGQGVGGGGGGGGGW